MASKTATQIKTTLEGVTFPYPIRFYTTKQKYPIYPYCEIVKTPPQSTTEDVTDVTKSEGFKITLYIKYVRGFDTEEADQTTIENSMLTALEAQNFGAGKLYMERKDWARTAIPEPFGMSSTITITITPNINNNNIDISIIITITSTTTSNSQQHRKKNNYNYTNSQ